MTTSGTDESSQIAQDIEGYLAQHEQKELLRFVAVGSVDDGKSTLIGRLLHDTKGIYEDQLASVKKASAKKDEEIDFSLFTDGLKAEREQGITIDVAYRYFSTAKRKFIIADTPGHVQYTRNMATGASTADVAVILLDARLGVLPQSKRHGFIASLLGIRHLAVAVNKMDLMGFAPEVYNRLRAEFGEFTTRLGFESVTFFPVSAKKGDNVVDRSPNTPWYSGPTLLEYLETVPVSRDREREAFRYPVQYVLRPHLDYRGFSGQIASGAVRVGDEVMVLPSRRRTRVKAIDTFEGECERAFAPMSVTLRLADEVDVSRGDMIVRPDESPRVAHDVEAHLVWLSEQPMDGTRGYLCKHTTRVVPARIAAVRHRVDPETLGPVPAQRLELNDIGRVSLRVSRALFCDPYVENRVTGAFILIDVLSNNTVAAGMILEAGASDGGEGSRWRSRVSSDERRARLGHAGAAVWIATPPGVDTTALAAGVERALFDRGALPTVLHGQWAMMTDVVQHAVDAGLLVVCAGAGAEARDAARFQVGEGSFLAVRAEGAADADVARVVAALAERGLLPR